MQVRKNSMLTSARRTGGVSREQTPDRAAIQLM
jgi:hypothetical protein